ncbi:MAG: MarR family winged helix-turn-helix transcriptional regulator [Eubacterium sp.]
MRTEYLGLNIGIIANLYNRMIVRAGNGKSSTLTIHQCWVLQYLEKHCGEAVRQKDIENMFSIRRSTANTMLRTMEKNGFIERRKDLRDGRANILLITPLGLEASQNITAEMERFEKNLKKGISEEDLQQFQKTLDQMERNLGE